MAPAGPGRPIELTGPLGELAERMGGVNQLADAIGVTPRAIQRWHNGERQPSKTTCRLLAIIAKQHKVKPPFSVD